MRLETLVSHAGLAPDVTYTARQTMAALTVGLSRSSNVDFYLLDHKSIGKPLSVRLFFPISIDRY